MKYILIAICLSLLATTYVHAAQDKVFATLIVVEKSKRVLTLFSGKKPLKSYRIALGGNPEGHKQQEGDSRTPEGNYLIDAKNPNSSFHLSLHISYPNKNDRASARKRGVPPGGAVMIHGTPEALTTLNAIGFYSDWTAGCIAVTNSEIEEIYASIKTGTPIVIKP